MFVILSDGIGFMNDLALQFGTWTPDDGLD